MRRGLALIAAAAGLAWLAPQAAGDPPVGASPVRTQTVPSEVMEPTLNPGDTIDANYAAYDHAAPQLEDIVVVNPPRVADRYFERLSRYCAAPRKGAMCARAKPGLSRATYLKRVVGLPGDRLSLRHGVLYRNGAKADEPYTARCAHHCHFPRAIRVPAGHYFLLGDNRDSWFDARVWGPSPRRAIVARVDRCTPQPAVGCDPHA